MTIGERFDKFHAANPNVYDALVRLAREAKASGKRVGIKLLWEVARWELLVRASDEMSMYRLCNSYTSRYARLIMDREADLVGFFETRELRAA